MEKTRATTIQQRFGFADDDLKTSKHDEIMLWLNDNIATVVNELLRNEWSEEELARLNGGLETALTLTDLPPRRLVEVGDIAWEAPVLSENKYSKYIVGFVDLRVQCIQDCLCWTQRHERYGSVYWLDQDGEKIPKEKTRWWVGRESRGLLCFEVKTSIPSLGEVIRQIKMYEEYQGGRFVVVSPDARYTKALKSQGIWFYHYKENSYEETMR